MIKKFLIKTFPLMAIAIMLILASTNNVKADPINNRKVPLNVKNPKEVVYPVNIFDDGKAHFFQYKTDDGVKIRYFILKSSDGVIRAAFDACDVCWREGKGYLQKGDYMVCRNCGRRFPSTKINILSGGCNPAPLTRNIEGGNVVIKIDSILEGKRYFNFTRG
ncbi:MAG: DUF2318 domain-containing protein [Syntrophorhabdaceae bacterium]|nr:DUF2318 domain-containing protein [Syntrophorhabdaceae bacterium]